ISVSFEISTSQLKAWGIVDFEKARRNLGGISASIGAENLTGLRPHFGRILSRLADADMALNNLERFFASSRAPNQLPALLEDRGRGLDILLQILSASQFFSDLLAADSELFEVMHGPMRPSPTRDELVTRLQGEIGAMPDD